MTQFIVLQPLRQNFQMAQKWSLHVLYVQQELQIPNLTMQSPQFHKCAACSYNLPTTTECFSCSLHAILRHHLCGPDRDPESPPGWSPAVQLRWSRCNGCIASTFYVGQFRPQAEESRKQAILVSLQPGSRQISSFCLHGHCGRQDGGRHRGQVPLPQHATDQPLHRWPRSHSTVEQLLLNRATEGSRGLSTNSYFSLPSFIIQCIHVRFW